MPARIVILVYALANIIVQVLVYRCVLAASIAVVLVSTLLIARLVIVLCLGYCHRPVLPIVRVGMDTMMLLTSSCVWHVIILVLLAHKLALIV